MQLIEIDLAPGFPNAAAEQGERTELKKEITEFIKKTKQIRVCLLKTREFPWVLARY